MTRRYIPMILVLSAGFSQVAVASVVPGEAVKDADNGHFHRELAAIQPLLADHAQDAEVQFRYGQALHGIGKADGAIAALKTAISLDPKNGVYHRVLGESYGLKAQQTFAGETTLTSVFSMHGLMKSAQAEFEAAVQLAPADVQSHVDLANYYIVVPSIMGGSYSRAHAEEEIIDKLDSIQGLQVRASEAGNKNDVAAGEALLKRAIAEDPTSGSLIALGLFYADAKRYDDAFQAFRDAQAKDPKAYTAWYQVGRVAGLAKGNYDEGIESLKRYLAFDNLPDTDPTPAWAHLRLGNLYEYRADTDLARAEYRMAESMNEDADPELVSQLKTAESRLK